VYLSIHVMLLLIDNAVVELFRLVNREVTQLSMFGSDLNGAVP